MKAYTRYKYGGPEVIRLEEVEKPVLEDDHVLVKIMANSANRADWHILRGDPFFSRFTYGLFKPKDKTIGSDFSGVVEQVGKAVTLFKVGDRVFGSTLKGGAFAEYFSVPANACALAPDGAEFVEMACLPIAGLTALQALTRDGGLKSGETVLINGATGGVGHFAVQMAKAYGATVTAVCSGKNESFVKELGADIVVAYDRENIHEHTGRYDLVVDVHGDLTYKDYERMGKRGVKVGFTTMKNMISVMLKAKAFAYPFKLTAVDINTKELELLASLVQQHGIKAHMEKLYSYQQIPEAISALEKMRTRGKIGIVWKDTLDQ
jgi:NADPH:quinone reductase-like Zn-dependent oxidoreductase